MLIVWEDIPTNICAIENKPIEGVYLELNLPNEKWHVNFSYNPRKNSISTHIDRLKESLDLFSAGYEKVILPGDFKVAVR